MLQFDTENTWPNGPRFTVSIVRGYPISPGRAGTGGRLRAGVTATVFDEAYQKAIAHYSRTEAWEDAAIYAAQTHADHLNQEEQREA